MSRPYSEKATKVLQIEVVPGYDYTICACDTDNCNGATMAKISTLGIIAVIISSFLD